MSFEAYKAILKENGLDLDVVKDGNAKAIQQLQGMVWMMPQLKDVILLLQGSTANIDAMQTYLDTVNGGIAQLHEGSSTLNSSYGEFDAGVRQLAGVLTGMLGNLSVLTDGVNQLAAGGGVSADRRHRRAAQQRFRHRHGRPAGQPSEHSFRRRGGAELHLGREHRGERGAVCFADHCHHGPGPGSPAGTGGCDPDLMAEAAQAVWAV